MRKHFLFLAVCLSFFAINGHAQSYIPVASGGYNIDAVAESGVSSASVTTQALDWSNHVMYNTTFATNTALCGGLLNSGTIVSGSRTYQLMPYTGNNALYIANAASGTLTINTPSSFSYISLLLFSTEGGCTINVTFNYSGGTSTNLGSFSISDWFFASGAVYSGFGRCTRVVAGVTADGCPTDPRFYTLDFILSCADQQKNLQSITITTTSGNQGVYVMAVSGVPFSQTNTITPTAVSCNGGSNGSAALSVTGGNPAFTYSWNSVPVQTTATATNLPAGNYTCTIKDSRGCVTTSSVTITQPPALTLTPVPTNATCGNNNGSISVSASGGTPTYSFNSNGGVYTTTTNYTGLAPGTYTMGVKDSKGCVATATLTLSTTTNPTITVNSATICPGSSATLTANGATTYTWAPSGSLSSGTGTSVTATPTATTTYTITGSQGGCINTGTATVTIASSLTVSVNSPLICSGSSGTIAATGAASYSWAPAGGLSSTSGATVTATPSVTTTYTVTGTAGTCSSTATSTVTVNPTPVVTSTASPASICSGATTTLTAGGATTYNWNTGSSASTITVSPNSNTTYTVVGTMGGCKDSATVTVNVTPLPSLTITAIPTAVCSGTSVVLSGSGATNYTWSANAGNGTISSATVTPTTTDTYTLTGANGNCISTGTVTVNVTPTPSLSIAATPTAVCAGQSSVLSISGATTYTWSSNAGSATTNTVSVSPASTTVYSVTGNNSGCTATATVAVNVTPLPSLTITATPASICTGQSSILNGTGAATYTWSANAGGANTQTVSVSPGSSTTYTLYGAQGGCVNSTSITVSVGTAPSLTVSATQTVVCRGGTVTINGSGATNYTWSPGSLSGSSVTPTMTATTTFTVVGTNGGCSDSTTITINVNQLPTLTVTPASASICAGASDILNASGASTYTWSANAGSATTSTVSVNPPSNTTYTVVATGANGCRNSGTVTVNVNQLPSVNSGPDQSICLGNPVTLSGSGAVTYTWTGGVVNGTPFTPTATASYTVTGTNANGCTNSGAVTVMVNALPNVSAGPNQTVCSGTSVTLSGSGAVTYTWTGGVSNGTPFTPPAGTTSYTVTGTDANGCTKANVVNVTVNPLPPVSAGGNVAIPCRAGSFTLSGSTNATNPAYSWTGPGIVSGGTTATPVINSAGTYTLMVTGANGCSNTATATVTSPTLSVGFTPDVTSGFSPLIVSFNNTSVNASSFNWTFGNGGNSSSISPSTTYTTAGTYTVMLIGTNGACADTAFSTITVQENSSVNAPNVFSPNGDGINDLYFFITTGVEDLSADLYNRWGQTVGKINGVSGSWDGRTPGDKNASDGTYFYVLKAKGFDGKNYEMHGSFTLLR